MSLFSVSASRIRYEITSGNIGGAFAVKNMTGAIYVAGALDYETRKRVSPDYLGKPNFNQVKCNCIIDSPSSFRLLIIACV